MTTRPFSRLPIVRRVEGFIRERGLFTEGEAAVVAVSGGADSVFLLRALQGLSRPLNLRLHVAHLDHGWRGAEAEQDGLFVRQVAERLGLPCHVGRVDATRLSREAALSPEEGARLARYRFLAEVCTRHGIPTVATGHTQDDQLETFLLAWLRGSGQLGLAGMPAAGSLPAAGTGAAVRLVRPLLCLSAIEVRRTLAEVGQPWREDATNQDRRLLRNRVRHEVLPLLEMLAPGVRDTTLRSMDLLRMDADYLAARAREAAGEVLSEEGGVLAASRCAFLALHPTLRARVLQESVRRLQGHSRDVEAAHLDGALRAIERGRGGATVRLSATVTLRLHRGRLRFETTPPSAESGQTTSAPGTGTGADGGAPAHPG